MGPRPIVRCLIARQLANGQIGKSRVVSLAAAYLAARAGFLVVGPDPEDMETLAQWERQTNSHEPDPFNPPHST